MKLSSSVSASRGGFTFFRSEADGAYCSGISQVTTATGVVLMDPGPLVTEHCWKKL